MHYRAERRNGKRLAKADTLFLSCGLFLYSAVCHMRQARKVRCHMKRECPLSALERRKGHLFPPLLLIMVLYATQQLR